MQPRYRVLSFAIPLSLGVPLCSVLRWLESPFCLIPLVFRHTLRSLFSDGFRLFGSYLSGSVSCVLSLLHPSHSPPQSALMEPSPNRKPPRGKQPYRSGPFVVDEKDPRRFCDICQKCAVRGHPNSITSVRTRLLSSVTC